MSGYLLGSDTDKNSKWLYSRIKRIFIDYYIYIVVVVCVYHFFTEEIITLNILIDLLCGKTTIYGVEQLWFIRPLFLCYLHIFIIDYFVSKISDMKLIGKVIYSVIILFVLFFFSIEVDGHWLIVFASGYLIRKLFNTESCYLLIIVSTGVPTLVFSYLRIIDNANYDYDVWWHVFAGIFIFMIMYYLLRKMNMHLSLKEKKFLAFTDKYTYDIYLTHWLYITSYFSVLELTKNIIINFAILFILILFSAYLLYYLSKLVNKKITLISRGISAKNCIT